MELVFIVMDYGCDKKAVQNAAKEGDRNCDIKEILLITVIKGILQTITHVHSQGQRSIAEISDKP